MIATRDSIETATCGHEVLVTLVSLEELGLELQFFIEHYNWKTFISE